MEQTTKYDPTKNYKWDLDAKFTLDGQEFGFIFNMLLKKRKELMKELDMLNILQSKLQEAVDSGIATEITSEDMKRPMKPTE